MTFQADTRELKHAADVLDAVEGQLELPAQHGVETFGAVVQAAVRRDAARYRRTGKLERNIRLSTQGAGMDTRAQLRLTGMVAPIIVKGQRAHLIRAVGAHALHLIRLNRFAAVVRHRAVAPDPMVAEGVRAANLEQAADDAAREAARAIAAAIEGS